MILLKGNSNHMGSSRPLLPHSSPPCSDPLTHSTAATLASLLILSLIRYTPASGPLHWLFPLSGMPFPWHPPHLTSIPYSLSPLTPQLKTTSPTPYIPEHCTPFPCFAFLFFLLCHDRNSFFFCSCALLFFIRLISLVPPCSK